MTYEEKVAELFKRPLIAQGINDLTTADKAAIKQTDSINPALAESILLNTVNLPLVETLENTTTSAENAEAINTSLTAKERRELNKKFLDLGFTQKEINSFL